MEKENHWIHWHVDAWKMGICDKRDWKRVGNQGRRMLIPESQVRKVIQGGSGEMYHILLGTEWDEDWVNYRIQQCTVYWWITVELLGENLIGMDQWGWSEYNPLCLFTPLTKKYKAFSSAQSLNRVWLFATHESQHTRPPCPSPTPAVHSDSRPSSQWCHPAISSSVVPFSSCPQFLPSSESFPMSQLFAWGGQSTGVSALASFLPKKSQGWSPPEWTGWISLQSNMHTHSCRHTQSPPPPMSLIVLLTGPFPLS